MDVSEKSATTNPDNSGFYRPPQTSVQNGAGNANSQLREQQPASRDSEPKPFITSGLLAAAGIGQEIVEAILAQHRDGLDRSEWILRKCKEYEQVLNGRAA